MTSATDEINASAAALEFALRLKLSAFSDLISGITNIYAIEQVFVALLKQLGSRPMRWSLTRLHVVFRNLSNRKFVYHLQSASAQYPMFTGILSVIFNECRAHRIRGKVKQVVKLLVRVYYGIRANETEWLKLERLYSRRGVRFFFFNKDSRLLTFRPHLGFVMVPCWQIPSLLDDDKRVLYLLSRLRPLVKSR